MAQMQYKFANFGTFSKLSVNTTLQRPIFRASVLLENTAQKTPIIDLYQVFVVLAIKTKSNNVMFGKIKLCYFHFKAPLVKDNPNRKTRGCVAFLL